MYEIVKHTHLTAIALSVLLFLWRFYLLSSQSQMLQKKWLKVLPHLVDTILIISALILCVLLKQYPFVDAWVTEKLLALLMYVFMVTLALRLAKTVLMRTVGVIGAISWIAYAGSVAISKQAHLLAF
jgi:uncharacterized membrane protein SirB2